MGITKNCCDVAAMMMIILLTFVFAKTHVFLFQPLNQQYIQSKSRKYRLTASTVNYFNSYLFKQRLNF